MLIAGGSGFIGKHLTNLAMNEGYSVSWLTTNKNSNTKVKSFLWDPYNNIFSPDCLEDVDVIVNLCGENIYKRWNSENKEKIRKSRVDSTDFLIKKIKELKPNLKHFINASAIGIYPYSYYDSYYENSLDYGTHFLAEICKEWEFVATKIILDYNLTIFRFGIVFDIENGGFPKILKNPYVIGNGRQWISWIYINDLVRLILFSIENKIYGTYNATASKPVKQKELIRTLKKSLRIRSLPVKIPGFILNLIFGKEKSELFLKGVFASNINIRSKGFEFECNDIKDFLYKI